MRVPCAATWRADSSAAALRGMRVTRASSAVTTTSARAPPAGAARSARTCPVPFAVSAHPASAATPTSPAMVSLIPQTGPSHNL